MKNNTEKELVILSDVILMDNIEKSTEKPSEDVVKIEKQVIEQASEPVKIDTVQEKKNTSTGNKKRNKKKNTQKELQNNAQNTASVSVEKQGLVSSNKDNSNKNKPNKNNKKEQTNQNKREQTNLNKKEHYKGKKTRKFANKTKIVEAKPISADEMLAIANAELSKTVSDITQAEAEFQKANAELSKGISALAKEKEVEAARIKAAEEKAKAEETAKKKAAEEKAKAEKAKAEAKKAKAEARRKKAEAKKAEARKKNAKNIKTEAAKEEVIPAEKTEAAKAEVIQVENTQTESVKSDNTKTDSVEVKNTETQNIVSENIVSDDTAAECSEENTSKEDAAASAEQNENKLFIFKGLVKNDKYIFISGVVFLVVLLYSCMVYNYRDMFFLGTKINGLNCENMTAVEAEKYFRDTIESYALEIDFRDGSTGVLSGKDFDYKYVSDGSIAKLMEKQNSLFWIFTLFFPPSYEIPEKIEFDRSKLADAYYDLESTDPNINIPPTNACVTYEEDKFVVQAEDEGNDIDHHKLIMIVNQAVDAGVSQIKAEDYDVYARPTIFMDEPILYTQCDQLNEIAAVSITYTLPNGEFVLDGNVVKEWMNKDEQGNYSITDEEMTAAIAEFVDEFAKEVNTVGTDRPFHATSQGDITVSGGTYGWKINEKEEEKLIAEAIANHSVETREPVYTSKEVTTDNNGFGDTYIEIDLSNQHLWYYIDGELYVESDFVSGTYTVSDRRTPPGIFLLTYKQRDRVLRGQQKEDGTYEYESPVSFWMPFNRGIGLHDASWRGSFGGTIYKYSGSHGCINLPYKKAQAIYDQIDKSTPIICFY